MSGISITADSATQFTANTAEYNSICRLDDDTFVVAYRDNSNFNYGKALVGTRSGTAITISEANAVTFSSADTEQITIRALSSTKIVIVYSNNATNESYGIVGTVSGTSITFGTAVEIGTDDEKMRIAVLDASNVVFCLANQNGSDAIECFVASISGTVLSIGAVQAYAVGPQVLGDPSAAVGLDSTHFAFAYQRLADDILIVIASVNTGAQTITFGTPVVVSGNDSPNDWNNLIMDKFDSTHIIVGWTDFATRDLDVTACSVNLTTLTLTYGAEIATTVSGLQKSYYSICTMGSNNFLVAWYTQSGTQVEVRSGTLTGSTTIAWDTQGEVVVDNGLGAYTAICSLTSTYFILGYKRG